MMFITENQKSKINIQKKLDKFICVDLRFDLKGSRIISNFHDLYK